MPTVASTERKLNHERVVGSVDLEVFVLVVDLAKSVMLGAAAIVLVAVAVVGLNPAAGVKIFQRAGRRTRTKKNCNPYEDLDYSF